MDLLTCPVRSAYFKYLSAAFGSAMIASIYSIVDMAMVGQYEGPNGTAALATASVLAGADAIWFSMPLTEFLVAAYAARRIAGYTKAL